MHFRYYTYIYSLKCKLVLHNKTTLHKNIDWQTVRTPIEIFPIYHSFMSYTLTWYLAIFKSCITLSESNSLKYTSSSSRTSCSCRARISDSIFFRSSFFIELSTWNNSMPCKVWCFEYVSVVNKMHFVRHHVHLHGQGHKVKVTSWSTLMSSEST